MLPFTIKILILLSIPLSSLTNVFAMVSDTQQQNAICFIKKKAPQMVFGHLPFSCNGQPEKFVTRVKNEINFLQKTNIIPNIDKCLPRLKKKEIMITIAATVWHLRDSPVLSDNAAIAFAISKACEVK